MTEDSNRDRGLELDAGTSTTRERVILTQPRLQFGTGATRGLLLRDGQYFKFGASNNDGVATVRNARLVANSITLNRSATDLRTTPNDDPLTTPYVHLGHQSLFGERGILSAAGLPLLITADGNIDINNSNTRSLTSERDIVLTAERNIKFLFKDPAPATSTSEFEVNSTQLHQLVDGGLAATNPNSDLQSFGTTALHRHNVWAAVSGTVIAGMAANTGVAFANQIAVLSGRFSLSFASVPVVDAGPWTVNCTLGFINGVLIGTKVGDWTGTQTVLHDLAIGSSIGIFPTDSFPVVYLAAAGAPEGHYHVRARVTSTSYAQTVFEIRVGVVLGGGVVLNDLQPLWFSYLVVGPVSTTTA